MKEKIKSIIRAHLPQLIDIRRHLHEHPELSFQEYETMDFISRQLNSHDIAHDAGVADTGIVGVIGSGTGKCVGLRADIDALPIFEQTDVPFKSQKEGIMHACGHDVHTTCLIGATIALKAIENDLQGKVKFIFQPAEEQLPGGAKKMIAAGVLTDAPKVDLMLGQHVHPPLDVGQLGFKSGMSMASANELTIIFKGKGGHAAAPRNFIDPVTAAATFITTVQQVVSRKSDPSMPTVVSFGGIETKGGTYNVIPERVVLKGTLRTMNEDWKSEALTWIRRHAEAMALSSGCEVELDISEGYPMLHNDEELTERMMDIAHQLWGQDAVYKIPVRMGAEDFARYAQEVPAVFYRLGIRNEAKGIVHALHSPYFDVDEEAIFYGATTMAYAATKLM